VFAVGLDQYREREHERDVNAEHCLEFYTDIPLFWLAGCLALLLADIKVKQPTISQRHAQCSLPNATKMGMTTQQE
jgi:hypothetical protein